MLHALSWCDSASILFGVGKVKALAVSKEVHLQHPGCEDDNLNDVMRNKIMRSFIYIYIKLQINTNYKIHKQQQSKDNTISKVLHPHLYFKRYFDSNKVPHSTRQFTTIPQYIYRTISHEV